MQLISYLLTAKSSPMLDEFQFSVTMWFENDFIFQIARPQLVVLESYSPSYILICLESRLWEMKNHHAEFATEQKNRRLYSLSDNVSETSLNILSESDCQLLMTSGTLSAHRASH